MTSKLGEAVEEDEDETTADRGSANIRLRSHDNLLTNAKWKIRQAKTN
jgi:hypothetical protein